MASIFNHIGCLYKDFNKFTYAFESKTINCTDDGDFYEENIVVRAFRWLFRGLEDSRLNNIARVFTDKLRELEVEAPVSSVNLDDFKGLITVGDQISKRLAARGTLVTKAAQNVLQRHLIALEYRIEYKKPTPSFNPHAQHDQKEVDDSALFKLASEWKKGQLWAGKDNELSHLDHKFLKQALQYSQFIKLIKNDTELQQQFFHWIFHDHNTVQGFIEFPAVTDKIKAHHLSDHFGYYAGEGLQVEIRKSRNAKIKDYTIKYEGEDCKTHHSLSLLNDKKKIKLRNGYEVSLAKILDVFSKKDAYNNHLTICGGALHNWNVGKMGRFNPNKVKNPKEYGARFDLIDLTKAEWWKELPPGRFMRLKAAQYLCRDADGIKPLNRDGATRAKKDKGIIGQHAYIMKGIPVTHKNQQGYEIHTFSRFPNKFPRNYLKCSIYKIIQLIYYFIEAIKIMFSPAYAEISGPDTSLFSPIRQHGGTARVLSEIDHKISMENIKQAMLKARRKGEVYNVFSSNCAMFTKEMSKGTSVENEEWFKKLYVAKFEDSEPEGITPAFKMMSRDSYTKVFKTFSAGSSIDVLTPEGTTQKYSLSENLPFKEGFDYHMPASSVELFDQPNLHVACCKDDASEPHALQQLT